jgi:hypothetical protein
LELPAKEDGDQPTVMDAIFLGLSNFNQSPIFAIDVTHLRRWRKASMGARCRVG